MASKRKSKKPEKTSAPKRSRSRGKPVEHDVAMIMAMRRSGFEDGGASVEALTDDADVAAKRRRYEQSKKLYESLLDDNQNVARQYNAIMGLNMGENAILTKYMIYKDWVPQVRVIMGAKQLILMGGVVGTKQTEAFKQMKQGLETAEKEYVESAQEYEKELKELRGKDESATKEIDRVEKDKKKLEEEKKEADDYGAKIWKWLTDLFKDKEEGKVSAQAFSSKEKEFKAQAAKAKATSDKAGAQIQALSTRSTALQQQRNQVRQRAQQVSGQRITSIPEHRAMADRVRADITAMAQREGQVWNELAALHQQLFGNRPMPLHRAPIPPPQVLKQQAEQVASQVHNHIHSGLSKLPRPR